MTQCRICEFSKRKKVLSKDGFKIVRCNNCGFGYYTNPPSEKELKTIYNEGYHQYISNAEYMADARKKYKFVKRYSSGKIKVLDYGCAWGQFLSLIKKDGHEALGFDISRFAAKKAKSLYGIKIKTGKLLKNTFKQSEFDVIVSFDVIEHILDFNRTLKLFKHWLKPNGFLFLTTPSLDSIDAKLLKKRWYGFTRIPQHVNYFSNKSLKMALENNGFKVIKLKPWGFVRSLGYLAQQIRFKNWRVFKNLKIYLPLTDVMVVAKKP